MVARLRDAVFVGDRWFRRGQSRAEVGDVAAQIGDHAWVEEESGSSTAVPAPPSPTPDEPEPVASGAEVASAEESEPESAVPAPAGDTEEPAADEGSVPHETSEAETVADSPAPDEAGDAAGELTVERPEVEVLAPEPPPQAGAGSGEQAWRDYAAAIQVDVTDLEKRSEIIAAVKAAGKPV